MDERDVVRDGRDHAQEVEELVRATGVRKVEALDDRSLLREDCRELHVRGRVRPVAPRDGERGLVEPEHVPSVGDRVLRQCSHAGDAEVGERRGEARRLLASGRLRHPELDEPGSRDEHWVVGEAGVHEPVRRLDDGDLDAEAREELRERGVVAPELLEIGSSAPARACEVSARRLAEECVLEWRGRRADAVRSLANAFSGRHGSKGYHAPVGDILRP